MGTVVIDMSMSLDGYITGPHDSPEHPLGEGGTVLHDWMFDGQAERTGTAVRTSASATNRAIIDA